MTSTSPLWAGKHCVTHDDMTCRECGQDWPCSTMRAATAGRDCGAARRALILLVAVLVLAGGVGGALVWHRAHSGSVTACEAALRDRLTTFSTTFVVPATQRPAACNGLSDAQLADVGRRLSSESTSAPSASPVASASPASNEAACRDGMTFDTAANVLQITKADCVGLTGDQVSQIAVDQFGPDVMSATVQAQ